MRWVTGRKPRRSTTARGYGYAHQQSRRRWAEEIKAGQVRCGICGTPLLPGQRWELDHVLPISLGGRDGPTHPAHYLCNRRKGGADKLKRSA